MKVLVITLGTRGDVQPFVALAKGLKQAGHEVTLCTSCNFEGFVRGHGLDYAYMGDEIMRIIDSAEGRAMMEDTTTAWAWLKTARKVAKLAGPMQRKMLEQSREAALRVGPDLIVCHPKAYGGLVSAEELGVPAVLALPLPLLSATGEFPAMGFPAWKLGGWYNRLTYSLVGKLMGISCGRQVRAWRSEQGLPPLARFDLARDAKGERVPVLHAFSRHVVPAPGDWPADSAVTGYWFLEEREGWRPSRELEAFLGSGEPPVYVGFGSMAGRRPEQLTRVVVEALGLAKVRGVVATGWGGLSGEALPETVFRIEEAPHGWLFPRVSAVVHHGGSGTTAAGLRAGRPTVVCPFMADQPFWGRRVRTLGVGSTPIPQKKLTAERLAAAIREVTTDAAIRRNAEALGERIRGEDGAGEAVAWLERIAAARSGSGR